MYEYCYSHLGANYVKGGSMLRIIHEYSQSGIQPIAV